MGLLREEEINHMAYPQWAVYGILPAEGVSMVYGRSGTGKSFWVLDMAACVATGREWDGHKVQQGPVVYVAGEGKSGYGARLEAWKKKHGVSSAQDFYLYDEPVRLWSRNGNRESTQQFLDAVNGAGVRPALVVLDTLGTCLGGADENDNGHMRELLDSAEEISRKWGCAVLLVHHTGKSLDSRTPRGAQALADGVAMHAYFHGDGKTYGMLDCTKLKDGDPFGTISRPLYKMDLGKGASSLAFSDAHKTGNREKKPRVSWQDIRDFLQGVDIPLKPATIAQARQWDRGAVWQHMNRAAQRGEVYQPEPGNGAYALVSNYVASGETAK
jgi:AAA domain